MEMSKQHDRITEKLESMGMAWAVCSYKYCDANDPMEDQIAHRKTYHIHPNARYPYQNDIFRFDSLTEIAKWLNSPVEEW
ncbi:MAG: hypothetical protein DDT21_01878 [Syntrophomonadaceae bacterium]|nr:hypothetical protein [Bacillota bacterium]